jgi:hypothetical protein
VAESSEYFGELFAFDPATLKWTELAVRGTPPSPRFRHGFAATGGQLYVHGGEGAGPDGANQHRTDDGGQCVSRCGGGGRHEERAKSSGPECVGSLALKREGDGSLDDGSGTRQFALKNAMRGGGVAGPTRLLGL